MPVLGPSSRSTNNAYEDESLPRNTVHEVVETQVMAVKFTDGYGKTQMRLVVMVEGQPFLLPEEVSSKAKASQKWFATQMMEKLNGPAAPKKKVRKKAKKAAPVEQPAPAAPPVNMDAL